MSSVSGTIGYPFVGAYAASKHGLEGFSESLRRELTLYGIDVIVIGPGAIATPIWDKAEQADLSLYTGTDYAGSAGRVHTFMIRNGKSGLPAEKVGEVVLHALTTPRPRVRYAVARRYSMTRLLIRVLPKRVVDRFIARSLGLK
jgi:short-subunit dehydrogenase